MSIGILEIIVVACLAMKFFTPQEMQDFAQKLGTMVRSFREGAETLSEPIKEAKETVDEVKQDIVEAVSLDASNDSQKEDNDVWNR